LWHFTEAHRSPSMNPASCTSILVHLHCLHINSYPHFSCPPCLEYLHPCTPILLRLWCYISHVLTYLLIYLVTYLLIVFLSHCTSPSSVLLQSTTIIKHGVNARKDINHLYHRAYHPDTHSKHAPDLQENLRKTPKFNLSSS